MKETDPKEEIRKGRMALWLDPDDIRFLADEWRKVPKTASEKEKDAWERIAFRAMAALQKKGVEYNPKFPDEDQKFKL